jgi:hypothetical protein
MRGWRVVYWFVTGACLGLGLDIYALGTLCLAGVLLLLVGVFALRGREAVATVLGLGVGFAAVLPLVAYTPYQGGAPSVPLVYVGVVVSILILVGLVALVVVWRTQRRGAGPNRSQGV